jgi:hypothetical protein
VAVATVVYTRGQRSFLQTRAKGKAREARGEAQKRGKQRQKCTSKNKQQKIKESIIKKIKKTKIVLKFNKY